MDPPCADRPAEDRVFHGVGVVGFVAFVLTFVILVHWHYPDTGHDFGGVFVRLLEGSWHFHHRGLAVPRYAVHVCGGSVLYGNPEDLFYSPAQLLSLVLDPWITIQLILVAALIAGYVGWYRVGRRILGLAVGWAHLLALVVQANGFYFLQMLSGHFMFHALALLGWFVLLLFERGPLDTRQKIVRVVVFAGLCGYVLYSGNWIVLYFLTLALVFVVPLDLFAAERPWWRAGELARRFALYGAAAMAVMASKLVAIYSFMRFFPRRVPLETMDPSRSTLAYVLKALWMIPQNEQLLESAPSFIHEKSMFMAPVTGLGLLVGAVLLARRRFGSASTERDRWFVAIYGVVSLTIMVQLVRGRGWFAEILHDLPVGASQRLSTRYLYLFALLLSVAAVQSLARATRRVGRKWCLALLASATFTTVAAFSLAHVDMLGEVGLASNMTDHRSNWRKTERHDVVTRVSFFTEFNGATGRTCYDPILNAAGTPSEILHEGAVSDLEDGYLNMMNPACCQYPAENRCSPGARIAVADIDNLLRFANGRAVTWRISTAQRLADLLSLASMVAAIAALIYAGVRRGGKSTRRTALPSSQTSGPGGGEGGIAAPL